jgi:hypothetical protein
MQSPGLKVLFKIKPSGKGKTVFLPNSDQAKRGCFYVNSEFFGGIAGSHGGRGVQ